MYSLKCRFSDFSSEWINWNKVSENRLAMVKILLRRGGDFFANLRFFNG